jgi:radical SAM enzyme (TIGR01210 family)
LGLFGKKIVASATVYIPFGCIDWGEKNGRRSDLCVFCAIPNAMITFREEFYDGNFVPADKLISLFHLSVNDFSITNCHTLMIFNGGSFLSMPSLIQVEIIKEIVKHPSLKRIVIESRAELITNDRVGLISEILQSAGKNLTVRIGVETQDDSLRLKFLRKGHSRKQLHQAVEVLKKNNVSSGGYVLLNPVPELEPLWAVNEAVATIEWILGELGMNEAYFCSTNVGPGTVLEKYWLEGKFNPASLWMVLKVLNSISNFTGRVHLLPFKDEPQLIAISSNHVLRGVKQSLEDAKGCDLAFHKMFDTYRMTMNPEVLNHPECDCKPGWF